MKHWLYMLAIALLPCAHALADEEDVYQQPEDFISEVFSGKAPEAQALAIPEDARADINAIMEHPYKLAGTRYWKQGRRSAWILEEIGKYKPITVGIVVDGKAIEQVKVLIYRESHGWQVKRGYFTEQFRGAELTEGRELTRDIDNISGATMSVDALRNLGKLALYLSQYAERSE